MSLLSTYSTVFFFNDTATTEIYTLSLHDALPILLAALISLPISLNGLGVREGAAVVLFQLAGLTREQAFSVPFLTYVDRKSTRLNSSHQIISYAVFCLKKKKSTLATMLSPLRPDA